MSSRRRANTGAARTVESLANRAARNGGTRYEYPPEGGCQVPIGSYAEIINDEIWLRALVGAPDGSVMVRGERRGSPEQAEQMGISLAEELLENGARAILTEVYNGEAPA